MCGGVASAELAVVVAASALHEPELREVAGEVVAQGYHVGRGGAQPQVARALCCHDGGALGVLDQPVGRPGSRGLVGQCP